MNSTKHDFKCPICKSIVPRSNEDSPFCSARCKTIDLGNWASDAYSINDGTTEDELLDSEKNRTIH